MGRQEKGATSKHRIYYQRHKEELRAKSRKRMALKRLAEKERSLTDTNTRGHTTNFDLEASPSGFDDYDVHSHNIFVSNLDKDPQTYEGGIETESQMAESGQSEDENIVDVGNEKWEYDNLEEADSRGDVDNGSWEYDHFTEIRKSVLEWAGRWCGYMNWPDTFDVECAEAAKSGHLDEWIYEVNCHASRGRRYLSRMENINGMLPKEMWRIRELWRQQVDLLKILLRGIDSIELRVNIVEKGMFNLITSS